MALPQLLNLQFTIFFLVGAGYLLTRLGIFPVTARKPLTDLVLDFILPCNIIVSFIIEFDREVLTGCLLSFAVAAVCQVLTCALGYLLYGRDGDTGNRVLQYATFVSNAGFLGLPIISGLYGARALLYASVYLIPQRIMMWSAGVSCFENVKGRDVLKKIATHPCIIATVIGLGLMLTQLPVPAALEQALRAAGNCNTGLSMIVVGNILAGVDAREVLSRRGLGYCVLRLAVLPLCTLVGCRLVGLDALVTKVSVILSGMPAAATTALMAARYNTAEKLAAGLVFLSTLVSLVTIPLLALLMELL